MVKRIALAALLLAYITLAALYSIVVPAYESPDEIAHWHYVKHLLTERALPKLDRGSAPWSDTPMYESHNPPLYYLLAAGAASLAPSGPGLPCTFNPQFKWTGGGDDLNLYQHRSSETFPFRGSALAFHLARLVSVLLGAGTVALTVLTAWELFPNSNIGLLAGALVAFNPQFLFITGSVNNDSLLALAAAGLWWQLAKATENTESAKRALHQGALLQWALVGIWLSIGLLAKSGISYILPAVTGLVLSAVAIRERRLPAKEALIVTLIVLLLAGWWFVRNQRLYGDPLGAGGFLTFCNHLRRRPLHSHFFGQQFLSFWGKFGWMTLLAPDWFYWLYKSVCILAAGGLILASRKKVLILSTPIVASEALVVALGYLTDVPSYQGRYLFPVIGLVAILLSYGLWQLVTILVTKPKPRSFLAILIALGLLAIAVYTPFGIIEPAYRPSFGHTLPKWKLWQGHPVDAKFGGYFWLRGYTISTEGENVTVTLYWQCLETPDFNYSAAVHLLDDAGHILAQKDHAPGEAAGFPPIAWLPGDIAADEHRIAFSGSYKAIRIIVYNWATGEVLPASGKDCSSDYVMLAP